MDEVDVGEIVPVESGGGGGDVAAALQVKSSIVHTGGHSRGLGLQVDALEHSEAHGLTVHKIT